ncbi:MAG: mechanosensitive ion channel domain-containing protein [Flavobacteriales bacterium]
MKDVLFHIGPYAVGLGRALSAVVLVGLGLALMRLLKTGLERRATKNPEQRSRLYSARLLVNYGLWVVVAVGCLALLRIDVTVLLAGSAALLVVVGLGVQQTFTDVFAGVILLIEGTIRVGDVLELGTLVGRVKDIRLRTSTIHSRDGMNVVVPNRRFINENVVNWSHSATQTRFSLSLSVAYGSDERRVRTILLDCANGHQQVITQDKEHPASVRLVNFGASTLDFDLQFWSRNVFYIEQTKSEIRFAILEHFRAAGITLTPVPSAALHVPEAAAAHQ